MGQSIRLFATSFFASLLLLSNVACSSTNNQAQKNTDNPTTSVKTVSHTSDDLTGLETAYFASGCFWCVEAIFESVEGVSEAVSGYAGGKVKTANYKLVSAGLTDHAEAVEVYYNPDVVSYETLLKVFFGSHDPTTLNRQGPDAGRQYRSAIFYTNESEKTQAEDYVAELTTSGAFDGKITTELTELAGFYDAEDYHQNYEGNNPQNPYVQRVSIPRLKRFQAKYPELLKKGTH